MNWSKKVFESLDQETVEHSLLSNALDFIKTATKELKSEDKDQIKYGLLHLFSGIALIIKQRLVDKDWKLIFHHRSTPCPIKYKEGTFQGILFDNSIVTLEEECSVTINIESRRHLKNLKERRNQIEHFNFNINIKSARSIAGGSLHFAIQFIQKELDISSLNELEEGIFEEIEASSLMFNEYVTEKLNAIQEESLASNDILVQCPSCNRLALQICDGSYECKFCKYEDAYFEEVLSAYLEGVLGIYDNEVDSGMASYPNFDCPSCLEHLSMVPLQDYSKYLCLCCKRLIPRSDICECNNCGQSFEKIYDDLETCSECMANIKNK